MSTLFRIEMLPAREGDCLLVTYGPPARPHRVLVDLGRAATYKAFRERVATLSAEARDFELLIVTHIDRDHIEGTLRLLEDTDRPVRFRDVWFNGYHHLQDTELETFGAVQGERLTEGLRQSGWAWNRAFQGRAARIGEAGAPPSIGLPGDLTLHLLSPDRDQLSALEPTWKQECARAGIVAGAAGAPDGPTGFERLGSIDFDALADAPFHEDPSKPNGSSIAVLAELDGRRALLAADAHPGRLAESLRHFADPGSGRVRLDAFKLPHHGSQNNLSRELLDLVDCPRYLVSTNSAYFHHPDAETIARLIKYGGRPTIHFNYRSPETALWDDPDWRERHGYETVYPERDGYLALTL